MLDTAQRRQQAWRLCAAVSFACLQSFAATAGDWGAALGISNYDLFRGLAYNTDPGSVQAALDYRHPNDWFAGLWLATVDSAPDPYADAEANLYLGRNLRLADAWMSRFDVVHYAYLGSTASHRYDYDEVRASVIYADWLSAAVTASPNTALYAEGDGLVREAAYSYSVALSQPLTGELSANAGGGYYDVSRILGSGYWFWSLGLTAMISTVRADLAYVGTDARAKQLFPYDMAADRWLATLTWRF